MSIFDFFKRKPEPEPELKAPVPCKRKPEPRAPAPCGNDVEHEFWENSQQWPCPHCILKERRKEELAKQLNKRVRRKPKRQR